MQLRHVTRRPTGATAALVTTLALVIAACGAADEAADTGGAVELPVAASSTDDGPTDGGAPTRQVIEDGPEAFLDRIGCELAPDAAVEELIARLASDVEVAPVVAAPVPDDALGGLAVGVMVGDEVRTVAVWHWDPEDEVLRPLTPEAAALEGAGADTSLVPVPDADGAITWTGRYGVPLVQDCATFVGQATFPAPPRPAPEVREDLVVVSPAVVDPGAVVEVTFPAGFDRGVAYALQREESPGQWVDEWWMTSDGNGGTPVTVPAGTEGYGVEDVGVGGPGPDRVLVDAATEPGEYRLCTANALEDVCALLTVTG